MAKTYKNIQNFLGIEALEVPADNSLYLVEELSDTLEERIGQALSKEATLAAKMNEIVQLNDTIKQLRDSIAEKDAALTEKDNNINALTEQVNQLNEQITSLNNDAEGKDNMLTEKDNTIAALNDQIVNLNQTITEKDAEIAALGNRAPEVPASQQEKHNGAQEEETVKGPHNVATEGMTLREKADALEKRSNELLGRR